jgi:NRPS condensation-like uncharacterized protein
MEREIKALERYFYRRPNSNVIMVARIRGRINEARLREVVNQIPKRHPILSKRIVQAKDGRSRLVSDGVPEPHLDILQLDSGKKQPWIPTALKELHNFTEMQKGPMIRYTCLKGVEGGSSYFLVNCHHTISDGISLVYLMRDIFQYLGEPGKEIEPLPEAPVLVENMPTGRSLKFLHKVLISRFNKRWGKNPKIFSEKEYSALHQKFWRMEGGTSIINWSLTKEEMFAFAERCRKEGVTVNSALTTAFLLAQLEVEGEGMDYLRHTALPVNVRGKLPVKVPEIVTSYFSYFTIMLKKPGKGDFWDKARSTHRHIKKKLTEREIFMVINQLALLHPTLIDSMPFAKYGMADHPIAKRFLKIVGNYDVNTGINISNLGKFEFPDKSGDLVMEELIGPSLYREYEEKYLGVVTTNGIMQLTLTYRENIISSKKIAALRDSVMKHLAGALS